MAGGVHGGGVCGRGTFMAEGVHGRGGMCGRGAYMERGHVWQGACVAGGPAWQGGGMHGKGGNSNCSGWYASYWNAFLLHHLHPLAFLL